MKLHNFVVVNTFHTTGQAFLTDMVSYHSLYYVKQDLLCTALNLPDKSSLLLEKCVILIDLVGEILSKGSFVFN